jgi:hypothetical protein
MATVKPMALAPIDRDNCELELRRCLHYLQQQFPQSTLAESPFDQVLANDDLLYAHFPHTGCLGLLAERGAHRIWWLASPRSLDTYLWAYYRGFRLDESNILLIKAVRDLDTTIGVLVGGLHGTTVYREIEPALVTLPLALHLGWPACWYMLDALRAIDVPDGAFDFELNPRDPVAHHWPSDGSDPSSRSPFVR